MTSVDLIEPPVLEQALLVGSPTFGEIILVRHGQQGDNGLNDPTRSKGGDAPLSELGLRQADAAAAELSGERIAAVYCSHLERAATTAQRIAARHGLEPIVDEALQEVGIYRDVPVGRTVRDEIGPQRLAAVRNDFMRHRRWDAYPLSETRAELDRRIAPALDRILAAHEERAHVAIVCHGGVINAFVRRLLRVDTDMIFFPAHASITRLGRGDGRLSVISLNERSHLTRTSAVEVTY